MQIRRAHWAGVCVAAGAVSLALAVPSPVGAATHSTYQQVNLVSDIPGKAQVTDPHLVNAWGASYGPTTPLWVSDNGKDVATLYSGGIHGGHQTVNPLVVSIPGGAPTGQVFNPTTSFLLHTGASAGVPAKFLFVGETGHLTAWTLTSPPVTTAEDEVVTPGAVYKGLALGQPAGGPLLYAADFSAGTVDVYNGQFQRVVTKGNFEDSKLPHGFAPFNVAVFGGRVYVAYAKRDAQHMDEIAGKGLGRVDVFSQDGTLIRRGTAHGQLNAPWGLTIAPTGFGEFSGDLLVGNFGDGHINAFNPRTLQMVGTLRRPNGNRVHIDGLWALLPGNGVEGGTDEVLFTAGPQDESHGLLGTLSLHH